MHRMPKKLGKRQKKALNDALEALGKAKEQLHSAIWYFENDAMINGCNWGYASREWTEEALEKLKKLFSD